MTTDEKNVRELLSHAPHLPGVNFEELAAKAEETRRSRRPVGAAWAIAASIAVVVAIASTLALTRSTTTSPPATTTPTPQNPPDYSKLVLRNGDRIDASGDVVSIPGHPVQFCDPNQAVGADTNPSPIHDCGSFGVNVTGVNLNQLTNRYTIGGSVTGGATLTGIYRDGTITVTHQAPLETLHNPSPGATPFKYVPCAPPAGGWPAGDVGLIDAVATYARTHPGTVVTEAVLHPTSESTIAYVLTTGDPAPVEQALRPTFGDRLCVTRSLYSQSQIESLLNAFTSKMEAGFPGAGISSTGEGLDSREQPQVDAAIVQLTPDLADIAMHAPAGLLQLDIWLTPQGS